MHDRGTTSQKRKQHLTIAQIEKARQRQIEKARRRQHEWQERQRTKKKWKGKRDVLCYRQAPMLRSEIAQIVADLKLTPSDDVWLSYAELRKLEGRAIAAAARSTLKKKIT
jgi:hypothetical protein